MLLRTLQAKLPHFEAGVSKHNVKVSHEALQKLNYHGPIALSWDDTALEQALSVWDKGDDIFTILRCSDGPIWGTSAATVDIIFEDQNLAQVDKVCANNMSIV